MLLQRQIFDAIFAGRHSLPVEFLLAQSQLHAQRDGVGLLPGSGRGAGRGFGLGQRPLLLGQGGLQPPERFHRLLQIGGNLDAQFLRGIRHASGDLAIQICNAAAARPGAGPAGGLSVRAQPGRLGGAPARLGDDGAVPDVWPCRLGRPLGPPAPAVR